MSTNFEALSPKRVSIVIAVVVLFHVFAAVAIITMPSSKNKDPLLTQTPFIEMQLVTPSIIVKEVEVQKNELKRIKEEADYTDKPVSVLAISAAQKPIPKINEPATKSQSTVSTKVEKAQPVIKKQLASVPTDNLSTDISDNSAAIEAEQQRQITTVQAEIQAQNDRAIEALRQQNLQAAQTLAKNKAAAQAAIEAANTEKMVQQQAESVLQQQREAVAKKAAEQVAQKLVSSEPVSYGTISKSSWLIEPRLNPIKNKNYNFRGSEVSVNVSFIVRVNGKIEDIKITKSSGSHAFNRDFMRALSQAKLRPAMRSSTPVKSIAYLPFRMVL